MYKLFPYFYEFIIIILQFWRIMNSLTDFGRFTEKAYQTPLFRGRRLLSIHFLSFLVTLLM
ncbi:hypothetical protein [Sulfolobus tengchongensis spindle-shaped virus 4]|nr:hypothetical protein [Sulfolobus tengchongensis spindle-shaped virus 4]